MNMMAGSVLCTMNLGRSMVRTTMDMLKEFLKIG
jgi:hypothetical protein